MESRRFLGDIGEETLAEMTGRKPAPAFNSGKSRFGQESQTTKNTHTKLDRLKPLVEL
jgi:hypothetical protein